MKYAVPLAHFLAYLTTMAFSTNEKFIYLVFGESISTRESEKNGIFISPFIVDFAMSLVSRNVDGFELS